MFYLILTVRDRKAKTFSTRDVMSFGQPLMKKVVGFDKKGMCLCDCLHVFVYNMYMRFRMHITWMY